jgi:hypothetical protein
MEGETEALKPLADVARAAAKARFDAIRADPAYKAVVNDNVPAGQASPLADGFIGSFVVNGKRANVANMRANLAGDNLAPQTIAAGTMNYLKKSAGADPVTGSFSQAGYNKAFSAIEPKADLLLDPKSAQQAKSLGNVAKYTQAQVRGNFINNSNTFTAWAGGKVISAGEKALNMAVPFAGLGTETREFLANRAASNAAKKSLAPGAGLTRIQDIGR